MDELIKGALQKSRVDSNDWLGAARRETCSQGDRVLFGDGNIMKSVRELLRKLG